MEQFCPWETAQYFVYSSNIPTLFFYSHIPAVLVALLVGLIVFYKSGKSKIGTSLLIVSILFSAWCIFDLILWATNRPDIVMFFWSLQILVEPLVYLICFYLVYLFVKNQDLSFKWKLLGILLYSPIVLLLALKYNLQGVNLADCTAIEGFIAQYFTYIIESIFILSIIFFTFFEARKISNISRRKEIIIFGLGILLFLIAFSSGNIIGSFTENWTLAQAGLIGMPIFIVFLAYLIVRFHTFNIKMFATQALMIIMWFLVLGILFIRQIENVRVVTALTLILVTIAGYLLIKSVKKEIEQKEKLQKLTIELANSNEKLKSFDILKSKFLSLASHQLRNPISAIISCTSMFLDGSFGKIDDTQKNMLSQMFDRAKGMNDDVEKYLTIAKVDQGGLQYNLEKLDLSDFAKNMTEQQKLAVEKRKLSLSFETDGQSSYFVSGDKVQLKQVFQNLIDNAMKFTKEGWIKVKLLKVEDSKKIRVAISDSGVGIKSEIMPTLFKEFSRGEGAKTDVGGSGIGIYLAKEIIEKGHHGKIWAESEGAGKGSTFVFELPLYVENKVA